MARPSYDDLINILNLQKTNYMTFQPELGTPAGFQAEIEADLKMLERAKSNAALLKAASETGHEIKNEQIMYGTPGEAVTAYGNTTLPVALPDWEQGCWQRYVARSKVIRASAAYNPGIADGLGMGTTPLPDPGQPTGDFRPALMGGYAFAIIVEGRGRSDQWQAFVRPVGTTEWILVKTSTEKSANCVYTPTGGTGENPVQLEGYIQLLKDDEPYGEPSELSLFTVNP